MRANAGGLTLTFGELAQMIRPAFRVLAKVLTLLVVGGAFFVSENNGGWLMAFFMIGVPAIYVVVAWSKEEVRGFPLLPILAIQHLIVYSMPLLVANPSAQSVADAVISRAGLCILLFLVCLYAGWVMAFDPHPRARGSRWNFGMVEGQDALHKTSRVAFVLLTLAIAFHLLSATGWLWSMLPVSLYGVYSILRSTAGAASMLGGMIGGMAVGRGLHPGKALVFWALVAASFVFAVSGVLLSAASGLVAAVALGLLFGTGRVPWRFLLVAFLILGFLNQGKFVMRQRYWNEDGQRSSKTMGSLPEFFAEWAGVSAAYLFGKEQQSVGNARVERGQSLLDRVNNLQNLTYVLEALNQGNKDTLNGETYVLIPALLVPRVFWLNKPRSHQGQVMLNLHFGRQVSLEATETTYVAWGLVPESVGNFGWFWGPVLLGLVMGVVIGRVEAWSVRVRLFSVEGIMTVVALVATSLSYEMVASVLVTATFQAVVASMMGGLLLYSWFGAAQQLNEGQSQPTNRIRGSKVNRYDN